MQSKQSVTFVSNRQELLKPRGENSKERESHKDIYYEREMSSRSSVHKVCANMYTTTNWTRQLLSDGIIELTILQVIDFVIHCSL